MAVTDYATCSIAYNENGDEAYVMYTNPASNVPTNAYIDVGFLPAKVTAWISTEGKFEWNNAMPAASHVLTGTLANCVYDAALGFTTLGTAEFTTATDSAVVTKAISDADGTGSAVATAATYLFKGVWLGTDLSGAANDVIVLKLTK